MSSNKVKGVYAEYMEKTGVTANDLQSLYTENDPLNIVGMNQDDFLRLYQDGIITIKENLSTLSNMIEEIGIEETIKIFKQK